MPNFQFTNAPLLTEVVAILRAEAARIGVKNSTLAANTGLSSSQLSKIFHANQIPTLDQIDAICHSLNLDISKVIETSSLKNPNRFDNTHNITRRYTLSNKINNEGF